MNKRNVFLVLILGLLLSNLCCGVAAATTFSIEDDKQFKDIVAILAFSAYLCFMGWFVMTSDRRVMPERVAEGISEERVENTKTKHPDRIAIKMLAITSMPMGIATYVAWLYDILWLSVSLCVIPFAILYHWWNATRHKNK